jgi:large repetitive protein
MNFGFLRVLTLMVCLAGAFAGVARALDFDDEDPVPPHSEVGMVYSYVIGSHAGCLPHHLEVLSGELPPGLSIRSIALDKSVVEGVATEAGTFSAWIALKDCENKSAETLFTFDVWARRWGITTTSLKAAAVGSPYSATLEGAGLPSDVTWEVTAGSLPPGLTLSTAGVISGTATAVGSSTFTVKATAKEKNFGPTRIDSKQFTLNAVSLAASASRKVAEVGVRFSSALAGSGGQSPYTWSATEAPAGLAVDSNGTISGVPTRAGSYTVTLHLVDANGSEGNVQVRLDVRSRLVIAAKALPAATAGHAYRAKVSFRGGVPALRWTIARSSLPAGLRLAAGTGTIAGVPRSAGTFRVTLRVRDSLGAVSTKTLLLRVH